MQNKSNFWCCLVEVLPSNNDETFTNKNAIGGFLKLRAYADNSFNFEKKIEYLKPCPNKDKLPNEWHGIYFSNLHTYRKLEEDQNKAKKK